MAKCKSVCTNKLSNCMSKIDNCLSKSKNLCIRCLMCTSGIIHSRDELPDDWAEDMDVKNEFPLSGVKTQAYLVPDFRSPDHHFWTTQPPPYNRSLLGRWACLCGLLPCCGHCCDSTPKEPCWTLCCSAKCKRRCTCCSCCNSFCDKCCKGSCCPCLSCVKQATRNDVAATLEVCSVTGHSTSCWRGFFPAIALYDLVFEANRSQFLSVWNLSMFFLTLTLLLSPLSFGSLHNVSCQAALGFTPSYRSWYNPNQTETQADGTILNAPSFLANMPYDKPWKTSKLTKQDMSSIFELQRARPVADWSQFSYQQSLAEAHKACTAACASDDVEVVANAYFMGSTDVFSTKYTKPYSSSYERKSGQVAEGPKSMTYATCGYFRSQYSVPPSDAVGERIFSNLNLYVRPLLLAAVNTRMNRFAGWAGIFWIAAVSLDFGILTNRLSSDIHFCPSPFDFEPKPRGWFTYPDDNNGMLSNYINKLDPKNASNMDQFKHLNATHFTCNIGADMVKKIRAKIQKDLPSKEYCTPVNYDPDDVSAALTNEVNKCFGKNTKRGLSNAKRNDGFIFSDVVWTSPNLRSEYYQSGLSASKLACYPGKTPEEIAAESSEKNNGVVGNILSKLASGGEKFDKPWDQISCAKSFEETPCLNVLNVPLYSKDGLAKVTNDVEFDMAHDYINDDSTNSDSIKHDGYWPKCLPLAKKCLASLDCVLNETTRSIQINSFTKKLNQEYGGGVVDACLNGNWNLGNSVSELFGDFKGSTNLPRLSSCARDRAYWYLQSNKAQPAFEKRLKSYAAEIGTTVKELKLDDFRQRLENEKLLKVAADWADLQNKAMCTCTGKDVLLGYTNPNIFCVPTDPALLKKLNECNNTGVDTLVDYNEGVCITSDYTSYSEPSQYDDDGCTFFCNDCKQLDYFKTFNATYEGKSWYHKGSEETLNVSKLERFTKMIWPNEVTDEYEKKYEPKGITLNVPMTFNDIDPYLEDTVTPRFIYNWLTLKKPLQLMLDPNNLVGNILGNFIGLIALGVDPLHTNPNFGADWTKATSVKSKPLTVGSAEELIRKHFSEKAGFARKIGTTWIFLQWVRLIGVVVELIALIYLAVKVLTRRYSSQPGALCHSVYLFLNGSAEERVEKIKSKTKKHVRDASGKFHLRKLSGKEDEDDAEAGVAEQKVSALITSNNSYLEKKRKNRQKFKVPSRVWASVLISLAMTLLSTAMCLNFWIFMVRASVSGSTALEGMTNGLNNPSGTLTKFLKKTAPVVRQQIINSLPKDPLGSVKFSKDFEGLATGATSGILKGLEDKIDGQSVVLNFTYNGINMPNVTLSAGSIHLLQTGIADCIANATSGPDIKSLINDQINEVSSDTMTYLETAMKNQLSGTGKPSEGLGEDLLLLYENVAEGVEDKITASTAALTNPELCVPLMRNRMSGAKACFEKVAQNTASTLPSPAVEELAKQNITYSQYKERAAEALGKQYSTYSDNELPAAMCQASSKIVDQAVQGSFQSMLSAESLLNGTITSALDSKLVKDGFENIPGIPGGDIYEYMQSLGGGDKEMLMGLGSKYLGPLFEKLGGNDAAYALQKIMADCYPNVTLVGDTYLDSAKSLYNSKAEAADLDKQECKERLYNAVDITKSPKYLIVKTILDVLKAIGVAGCIFACLCFLTVAYQIYGFVKRLQKLGDRQAKAIDTYYDPHLGYKQSLKEGLMTIVDICDIDGRIVTKEESDIAGNLKDAERKTPANIRWLAKKLAYRHLMHVPNFMGSFVFINAFSFWTYHVLMIWVGLPLIGISVALALGSSPQTGLWLPLALAFIVKFTMGSCIKSRVLADEKPYHRGIKFPVAFTIFDTLYSMLGAILGWASALTRMFTSFFTTLLLLPRLDLALPGSTLDGSHNTYLGLMETSRQRLEYNKVLTGSEKSDSSGVVMNEVGNVDGDENEEGKKNTEELDKEMVVSMTVDTTNPLEGVELVDRRSRKLMAKVKSKNKLK